jgi:general secretion pathway protein G
MRTLRQTIGGRVSGRGTGGARALGGFTLLEMMLVVVIMGILMTVAVVAFRGRTETVRVQTTKAKLDQIKSALEVYYGQYATYPASLVVLTQGATKALETRALKDGWEMDIQYYFPGTSGDPARPYDLFSLGINKQPGGDDIDAWAEEKR